MITQPVNPHFPLVLSLRVWMVRLGGQTVVMTTLKACIVKSRRTLKCKVPAIQAGRSQVHVLINSIFGLYVFPARVHVLPQNPCQRGIPSCQYLSVGHPLLEAMLDIAKHGGAAKERKEQEKMTNVATWYITKLVLIQSIATAMGGLAPKATAQFKLLTRINSMLWLIGILLNCPLRLHHSRFSLRVLPRGLWIARTDVIILKTKPNAAL